MLFLCYFKKPQLVLSSCKIRNINSLLSKCECSYQSERNRFFCVGKFLCPATVQLPLYQNVFNVAATNNTTQITPCIVLHRSFAKGRKAVQSDSESSDDENDIVDKYDKSCKIIKSHMTSLRLDAILKAALSLARNKIDTAFYESRIRVNGEKVFKKSQRLNVGDEVDVVKGLSPMNPNFLNISRVEITSAKADEDEETIIVKMKRYKSLQIENYEKAPYKNNETSN